MKKFIIAFVSLVLMPSGACLWAQNDTYDVFNPIAKYIRAGDAESLSAWFDDNLEVTVFSKTSDTSKSQARQIMRTFFGEYSPRSFEIIHTVGRNTMKSAIGALNASGETFEVSIFLNYKGDGYHIQQIKIERQD